MIWSIIIRYAIIMQMIPRKHVLSEWKFVVSCDAAFALVDFLQTSWTIDFGQVLKPHFWAPQFRPRTTGFTTDLMLSQSFWGGYWIGRDSLWVCAITHFNNTQSPIPPEIAGSFSISSRWQKHASRLKQMLAETDCELVAENTPLAARPAVCCICFGDCLKIGWIHQFIPIPSYSNG